MKKNEFNDLVRKALLLETKNRTKFLEGIEDSKIKKELAFILSDDTKSSELGFKTSAGLQSFDNNQFKVYEAGHIINQFTIVKLIATGGMGCVYLAFDNKLNRNVAIKTIRPEYLQNKISQQRLKIEAQILSQINTSSICQIYDYIETEDGDLLVLELLDGETLNKLTLSSDEQIDVFFQIASGLEFAHAKGVIHRDLKPDNIMIAENNEVKILDFGIAKSIGKTEKIEIGEADNSESDISLSNVTTVGSLIGTLLYMSPEQASMKEITTASDIYSLGIMMHEMLTGKSTYQIIDTKDFVEQIKNAEVLNLEYLPKAFMPIINSMIDIDPLKRPTASDVKNSLVEIRNLPKQLKKRKRNILVSLLVISLLGLALFQWNKYIQSGKKASLIQSLKLSINEISNTYQKIYTLPIHDISKDLENLSNKKNNLIDLIDKSSLLLPSEKFLYKGKTNFAYKDYKSSLPQLEKAWLQGIKTDDLINDLIFNNVITFYENTTEHFYSEGFDDQEFIKSQEEIYLKQAKKYMQLSKVDTQLNSIPKALLLWHKKDLNNAVLLLNQITSEQDWNFEAYQIQGTILYDAGFDKFNEGDIDAALVFFNQSKEVFKKASDRGRSFSKAHSSLCELNAAILVILSNRDNEGITNIYNEASSSCESSLNILPENDKVQQSISGINLTLSYFKMQYGENPSENIEKSIQASEYIKPEYRKYMEQGHIYRTRGDYEESIGSDPLGSYDKSIQSFEKANEVKDSSLDAIYTNIIGVYTTRMYYEYNIGVDPIKVIKKMKGIEKQAIAANQSTKDTSFSININFAIAYGYQALYENLQNINPANSVNKSVEHVTKASKFDANSPSLNTVLAHVSIAGIKYDIKNQISPSGKIEESLVRINKLLKANPKVPYYLDLKALILANLEYSKKIENPKYPINLSESIALYNKSLELNPNSFAVYTDFSELYLNKAKLSTNKKESLELGIQYAYKSIELNPNYAFTYFNLANLIDYGIQCGVFLKAREQEALTNFAKAKSINSLLVKE